MANEEFYRLIEIAENLSESFAKIARALDRIRVHREGVDKYPGALEFIGMQLEKIAEKMDKNDHR